MFLAIWFCISVLENFITILKAMVCTTKVKDETFRNCKRYEDKA